MSLFKDRLFYFSLGLGPLFWIVYGFGFESFSLPTSVNMDSLLLFFQIGLIYPVLEEVVFRGGLQAFILRTRLKGLGIAGVSAANILTSVIFAAFHLLNQSALWSFLIFFPSLLFGYFYDRYGRLSPSILLHVYYNTGFYIFFVS